MPQRGAPPARSAAGRAQAAPSLTAPPVQGRGGWTPSTFQEGWTPQSFRSEPPPEEPQAPGFFGGLREMFVPEGFQWGDVYRGPAYAISHPIEAAKLIGGGIIESGTQQAEQAAQAYQEGRIPEAIGHGTAAALPMIGPMSAEIGERIGRGEYARAAGNITGLVGPGLIARTAPKLVPKTRATPSPLPAAARAREIPTLPTERGVSGIGRVVEPIAERSLAGGRSFTEFREAQQQALTQWADDIVEDISGFSGTAEEVGAQVDSALKRGRDAIRQRTGQMYSEIDQAVKPETVRRPVVREEQSQILGPNGEPLTIQKRTLERQQVGGIQPKTLPIRQEAAKLLRQLNEVKTIPSTELETLRRQLESLVNLPPRTTFYDFQTGRSILLDVTRRFDDPVSGRRAGMSRHLAGKMDDAMEEALKEAGREDLLGQLREANQLTKSLHETFNESVIHKIMDSSPEKAHLFLTAKNTPLADIRGLKATLPQDTWQALKVQVVNDLLAESTTGELGHLMERLPDLAGGAAEYATGGATMGMAGGTVGRMAQRAVGKFKTRGGGVQNRIERLGEARFKELFTPPEQTNLLSLAATAERLGVRHESWIAAALNSYILFKTASGAGRILSGDLAGGLMDVGRAGGWYAAQSLLSRLLVSQGRTASQARASIEQLMQGLASSNEPLIGQATRSLVGLMSKEEDDLRAEQRREREFQPLPALPPLP